MASYSDQIPNVRIENIGTITRPQQVIKGFIDLPCWNGYFLFDDNYQLKEKVVRDGRIELWVDGLIKDGTMHFDEEQLSAYRFLVENQQLVQQSIVQNLKQEFPRLLTEEYAAWDQQHADFPQAGEMTPEFDFKEYIAPESISIGEDIKDGQAYVTWYFNCKWDPEHGFQVVTHRERVIEISPEADPWKIYKDNGTYEQQLKDYNERAAKAKPIKRKEWWQFWK